MKLSAVFAIAALAFASATGAAPLPETNGQRLARGLPPLKPRFVATPAARSEPSAPVKRAEPSARALKRNEPSARALRKRSEPSARAYAA
ncbi:hypothetical protein FB107DRAFT_220912 [Schizophyllum commune]